MGDRSEKVGERGQFFTDLRRIVGLCSARQKSQLFKKSRRPDSLKSENFPMRAAPIHYELALMRTNRISCVL